MSRETGIWDLYKASVAKYTSQIQSAKRISWRGHSQSIENMPDTARMQRALKRNPAWFPGSGSESQSMEETIRLSSANGPDHRANGNDWRMSSQTVTQSRIRWVVREFNPYRAAGEDGIFPALIQGGLNVLKRLLCNIFRACRSMGYTPAAWRIVKAIFIPKPGRDAHYAAKSFIPIIPTSFISKTLEKLVDFHM